MSRPKEISPKYLPSRPPIILTVVVWLLLDRLHPQGWVIGATWCFVAIMWLGSLMAMFRADWVTPAEIGPPGRAR